MKCRTFALAVIASLVVCSPVMAHPNHGHSHANGLMSGFTHPWFGVDHLLAMVAVGLLSVRIGGRAIWVLPLSFLGAMTLGGAVGMAGVDLHLVEAGIALSVVILGAALAAGKQYPLLAAAIAIGAMGAFHGHAHGTEMPAMTTPALYALGFISATAILHLLGIVAGKWLIGNRQRMVALRVSGAVISCVGMFLLMGWI